MTRKPILSLDKRDFRFDYYRGSGKGGQKRNKTSNCVRCTHIESKAVGKSEDGRSQAHNKRTAFKRCCETKKFKAWVRIQVAKALGLEAQVEAEVERLMQNRHMKFDGWNKEKGRWEPIDPFCEPDDLPSYVKGSKPDEDGPEEG